MSSVEVNIRGVGHQDGRVEVTERDIMFRVFCLHNGGNGPSYTELSKYERKHLEIV